MSSKLFASLFAAATTVSSLFTFSAPAQAATLTPDNFGVNTIKFAENTTVNFNFLESHGKRQTAFGVYLKETQKLVSTLFVEDLRASDPKSNDAKDDWQGTCEKTYSVCSSQFRFKAGVAYTFGIREYNPNQADVVEDPYSIGNDANRAKYVYNGSYTFNTQGPTWISNNPGKQPAQKTITVDPGEIVVAMEDGADSDYNDLIIKASVVEVPEPTTVLGLLGVGVVGLVAKRRSRTGEIS